MDPLFTEGLAEALSKSNGFGYHAPLVDQDSKDLDYQTAGHFVRWLIETRGMDCVKGVLGSKSANLFSDFRSACGNSFVEAVSEYSTAAPWFYPSPFSCAGDEIAPQEGELVVAVDFDCDRLDVRANGPSLAVSRIVRIDTPGRYHVWTSAPAFTLGSCAREFILDAPKFYSAQDYAVPPHWALPSAFFAGGRVHTLDLEAGSLELTVITTWDELTHEVVIAPASPEIPVAIQ